jgi:hypothetical protein
MRVTRQGDWAALAYNVRSIKQFQGDRPTRRKRARWLFGPWGLALLVLLVVIIL